MPVISESRNTVQKTGAYKIAPVKPVIDYVAMVAIAATIFLCAYIWPRLRAHIPTLIYSGFLGWVLIRTAPIIAKMFRSFNYHSIVISAAGLEYDDRYRVYVVKWQEITKVRFSRYLEWGVKTGWWVTTADGSGFEILDEWQDRRRVLAAFRKYLPGFAAREAKRGLRSWKEGVWICFQRANIGALLE
jgi:hypothetical protein